MLRLFIAIELPEAVRMRLAALGGGIPGARWVAPENIHLSLRFIGEVDEGQFNDIDRMLAAIRAPEFELFLEGVGFFGPARAARSIHVEIRRNDALFHLHDKIESAVVRAGFEPEGRKFTPHVTLARLNRAPVERIAAFVAGNNLFRAGPVAVDQFTLFSSFQGRRGPIYRAEQSYPLGLNTARNTIGLYEVEDGEDL